MSNSEVHPAICAVVKEEGKIPSLLLQVIVF
jgi:hypothetical protein